MIRTLMIFSTVDGHALAISRRIAALLEARGHEVTLVPVDEAFGLDCAAFDRILIGASIRYGRHHPALYRFIRERRDCLQRMPSGFFSVSAVARKPGKDAPEGNAYFRKLCALTGWTPPLAALFAGRIDYARYRVWDRLAIRCIMWLTDGPTDTRIAHEFTDWEKVTAFARHFAEAPRD